MLVSRATFAVLPLNPRCAHEHYYKSKLATFAKCIRSTTGEIESRCEVLRIGQSLYPSRHPAHVDELDTERAPAVGVLPDVSRLPTAPLPAAPSSRLLAPPSAPPPSGSFLTRLNTRVLGIFATNPSSGRSLGYVDGLRALAALGVLLLHTRGEAQGSTFILPIPGTNVGVDFGPILASGYVGVYLFFILSGFLLAQPWIEANYKGKPEPGLKHYFVLRITRIVPPYYFALLVVIVFFTPHVAPASLVYSRVGLFTIVAHLLFLQFLFPVTSASFRIAGQFWMLTMEMLFYLMLPLVVRAFYRCRWIVALPVGALVSFLYLGVFIPTFWPILVPKVVQLAARAGAPWYTTVYASQYVDGQFPVHAIAFALGITLANLFVYRRLGRTSGSRLLSPLTNRVVGSGMFLAGCIITVGCMYLVNPSMPLIHIAGTATPKVPIIGWKAEIMVARYFEIVESVGFALILAGASHGGQMIRALLGFTPLRIIGIVSYSVYLLHLPLLHNVMGIYPVAHQSPNALFVRYLVTLLAQVLPLSIALYLVVERPVMRWARQRNRPAPAPTTDAAAEPLARAPAVATRRY